MKIGKMLKIGAEVIVGLVLVGLVVLAFLPKPLDVALLPIGPGNRP